MNLKKNHIKPVHDALSFVRETYEIILLLPDTLEKILVKSIWKQLMLKTHLFFKLPMFTGLVTSKAVGNH